MRRSIWTAVAAALALSLPGLAAADDASGKDVFTAKKCNACHAVKAEGIDALPSEEDAEADSDALEPPDLSEVGDRHEKEWIGKYLNKKEKQHGKKHKKRFRGEDAEFDALVNWLASLKKK